jgi:hypothetical protein
MLKLYKKIHDVLRFIQDWNTFWGNVSIVFHRNPWRIHFGEMYQLFSIEIHGEGFQNLANITAVTVATSSKILKSTAKTVLRSKYFCTGSRVAGAVLDQSPVK